MNSSPLHFSFRAHCKPDCNDLKANREKPQTVLYDVLYINERIIRAGIRMIEHSITLVSYQCVQYSTSIRRTKRAKSLAQNQRNQHSNSTAENFHPALPFFSNFRPQSHTLAEGESVNCLSFLPYYSPLTKIWMFNGWNRPLDLGKCRSSFFFSLFL